VPGVVVVYAGLLTAAAGAASVAWPLRRLGIRTRRRGALVLLAGLLLGVAGALLPAPERRVARPRTRLDEFLPAWQFGEFHALDVDAPPARVAAAIRSVTADEILLFRTLTTIRRGGRPGRAHILNAPPEEPILDVATRTTFVRLADQPDEIVAGTLVIAPRAVRRRSDATPAWFRDLAAPGYAKAAINFVVEPRPEGGSRVTTETRVFATDDWSKRRFAAYWRVIYPGSALLRVTWLRAIRRRAEAPPATSP
jgi:hypothetical protein